MLRLLFTGAFLFVSAMAFCQEAKWQKWETEADTLLDRGEFKSAIKLYSRIIQKSKLKVKSAYSAVYKRAVSYYSSGEFDKALEDLNQFIPQYPSVPQARLLRALVYKGLGQTDQQMKDLDQALLGQPSNVHLLKWRASLYLEEEKFAEAKKDAMLVRLLQDDAETEMYLGIAYYNLEDADSAIICINKSIALDAIYLPAYLYGGTFCLEQENYELALQYLGLALRLEPKHDMATFYKGVALVELGKTDEGCRCIRKAFYSGVDDAGDYLTQYCFGLEN